MPDRAALPEIGITPEMIEAGVALLVSYDPHFESEEDFVRRFLAVVLCRNPALPCDAQISSLPSLEAKGKRRGI